MSDLKDTSQNIVIDVSDEDMAAYVDGIPEDDTQKPEKKRGRPKKAAAPAPIPVEEQFARELEQAEKTTCVTPEVLKEEALRRELQGVDYTKEDFQKSPNYLVEAGAGAGKTFIMVQRIVNQLVSGFCQPEDIVAITFTNKSTLEMQERLDKFLFERLQPLKKKADNGETLTGEEQALRERLEYLIRESGRMQVSTIHSFCQTMLESMPFSSPLGLDMQVVESDRELAKDFLRRKWREEERPFDVPHQLGVPVDLLENTFLKCCQNSGTAIGYTGVNSPEAAQWKSDVKDAVHNLQAALHGLNLSVPEMRKEIRELMAMNPAEFANNLPAIRKLIWESLINPKHFPLDWGVEGAEDVWAGDDGAKVDAVWQGQWGQLLRKSGVCLIHSYVMRDVEALLAEYRQEKIARHIATYNDLLLHARDMLRDKPEARIYFHQRHKAVYVDEMQDTDPVQTELLFYLTTAEEDFDGSNWKNCRPVPGSLFLVGDPKQAIYRFRGADIGVYNDLMELFRSREDGGDNTGAVGEKVTLRFNFRSSAEICALADSVFAPEATAQTQEPHKFVGGRYHANYVPMIATNGRCPRARTMYYAPSSRGKADDPRRVAAFIYMMIHEKRYVGIHRPDKEDPKKGKRAHPAQPEDFLILTSTKKTAQGYAEALRNLGIPAEVTGEKSFLNTVPVARAVLHLQSMLALRDDQRLLLVLRVCYGLKDQQVREFLQRTGEFSLTGAVRREKLETIQRALEELSGEQEMLAVCYALEEIAGLRRMARTQPAMAVIERLLEGGFGVWRGLEHASLLQRRQVCSEVQQFLNLVRASGERSFPALAAYAIECAGRSFEHELELAPSSRAVRIMNLHKAKGLEGEVVILACDWQTPHAPISHVARSHGTATEFSLLQYGYSHVTVGCPKDWDVQREEEEKYSAAEDARLLYVAATCAKTMLLVCGRNEKKDVDSYWQPLLSGLREATKDDPYYGKAFQVLSRVPSKLGDEPDNTPPVPAPVDPEAMEQQIRQTAAALAENSIYDISPSQLNHHARGVISRKDEEEPETVDSAGAADTVDRSEENEPAAVPPAAASEPAEAAAPGPYGPDWGTIVHRVMELAVRSGCFDGAALKGFARQAVSEQLPGGAVTAGQRKMLRLEDAQTGEAVIACLAEQAAGAAVFLSDEASPLRCLLADAESYPELPFFLQEAAGNSELYRHLAVHVSSEKARNRTLAVEGIIDLAIRKGDVWYVVDYKTDKLRSGESEEQFARRLREEYTPQITAYARVLERMDSGKTEKAWLCSIPLGGRLIELDIQSE